MTTRTNSADLNFSYEELIALLAALQQVERTRDVATAAEKIKAKIRKLEGCV